MQCQGVNVHCLVLRQGFGLRHACREPYTRVVNSACLFYLCMGDLWIIASSFDIEIILQCQLGGLRERQFKHALGG